MDLCVIEGDGIGHEVVPAAARVLQAALPDVTMHYAPAGWNTFRETGKPIPDDTLALVKKYRAVLFGAVSSPSYPVEGYYSPIVRLRRLLKTHANIRPISYLPVPAARAGVDVIIVRENTEDIYAEEEQTSEGGDMGSVKKVITRAATERISHTAYRLARLAKRRKVTVVHKANVLPQTDGLFRRVAFEIGDEYSDIETDELLVDTAAYWMVKEPTRFDIILTMNQYGDILSDMAAAWGGGLGFVPALNYGEQVAIAEPVHGSAPDIAGRGIANPIATILSGAMLVRYHWDKPAVADAIEQAVYRTLEHGAYTADIQQNGYHTTDEFASLVIEQLTSF